MRWALVCCALLAPLGARAAVNGSLTGLVTEEVEGKRRPVAGATVTASGPALQGEQTEFTDATGHYLITELPPGEYLVRFYFANVTAERTGIFLNADKTLEVNATLPRAAAKTYRIIERSPVVDVGNSQVQTIVTDELVRNTPVRGRTFDAVLTQAPGAARDAGNSANFSFNGATGLENNFLIDGHNTTNPSFGLLGTPLSLEFIGETQLITGGYNAEYGRATGGVVNVITKTGSNEFHGGAWVYTKPFQLDPTLVARSGEAIGRLSKLASATDFGFDLGGPIVKDRIWFYIGMHPQFETDVADRVIRRRLGKLGGTAKDTYFGDLDKTSGCPAYLSDKSLCPAPSGATGPFLTETLDRQYGQRFTSRAQLTNYIAKLNFRLNENHSLQLQYLGAPSSFDGVLDNPFDPNPLSLGSGFNGNGAGIPFREEVQVHDAGLHLISKLFDRKLQADLLAGYHYESYSITPGQNGDTVQNQDQRTVSLSQFENVAPCQRQTLAGGATFNPCPVQNYLDGGKGLLQDLVNQRGSAQLGLTYFLRLAGTHAIKVGGDFEDNIYRDTRRYSGHSDNGVVTTFGDGTVQRVQLATIDPTTMGVRILPNGLIATTSILNESVYARDSWNVGFVPGLTLNAGLRWEFQQVRDVKGDTVISISDNIAPRLGFVYDWTQKGRAKLYASFGRFYESIPADITDRSFSGEGIAVQTLPPVGGAPDPSCQPDANGRINPAACKFPAPTNLLGGKYARVAPGLRGQYSNEWVAGLQYDVGWDLVLGGAYIHRDLGRIIEDISFDGGGTLVIANPGEAADPARVQDLQNQIRAATDPGKKAELQQTLSLYQGAATFPKPSRDYNALVLTAQKRLSHHLVLLGSYTYSRTLGNYPGLFQASNGQIDPNITSQYDLKELLVNRNGPLPNDRPHNFKLTGAYQIPLCPRCLLTVGLSVNALSGRPIEVLGTFPPYGSNEVFILPRGAGGRTPPLYSCDLHLAYSRQFDKNLKIELTWDTFNMFNFQEVTEVDDLYSLDFVGPIQNGTVEDLKNLKNVNGGQPNLNANYGHATQYQAPLAMRFGLRALF